MPPTSTRATSRRLARAAVAERAALQRDRDRLERRRAALLEELSGVDASLSELDQHLELLRRLAPDQPDDERGEAAAGGVRPLPPRADMLRGTAIREAAVEVLRAAGGGPLHYRRWYDLLADHGYAVAGQDPVAVFLTQVGRSPAVRRTTSAGTYELDPDAPARLRADVLRLAQELRDLPHVAADPDALSAVRDRRERLTRELAAAERALDEAVRALAPSPRDASRPAATG